MTTGGNGSLNLWNYEYPEKRTKKEGEHEKGVVGKVSSKQEIGSWPGEISFAFFAFGIDWEKKKGEGRLFKIHAMQYVHTAKYMHTSNASASQTADYGPK